MKRMTEHDVPMIDIEELTDLDQLKLIAFIQLILKIWQKRNKRKFIVIVK